MKKKIWVLLIILSFVFVLNGTVNFEGEETENSDIPLSIKNRANSGLQELPKKRDIKENLRSAPDRILVKYKKQADVSIQESIKVLIEATHGIQEIRNFSFIKVYLYKTYWDKEKTLEELNKNPNIEYAEPDYIRQLDSTVPNDISFSSLWGLHNDGQKGGTTDADIDAPEAWDLVTGSSDVKVAVVDSGVDYNHEDLNANMWINTGEIPGNGEDDDVNGYVDDYYGINTVDDTGDPMDDYDHGTHCSGIIAAVGNNDVGVVGVSWAAKIMALKFLDDQGSGYVSDEIECIEYAIDKSAHIINASFGGYNFSSAEYNAIDASKDAGILFIAAAGNDGKNNDEDLHYPSSYGIDNIIAVAATDDDDDLASFSNYGPYSVDVAAPGVAIYSTVPNDSYEYKQGTSMATPYVAGLAALIKSYNLSLTWQQIRNRILSGADQKVSLEGKILTGARINAFNSINSGDITSYSLDIQSSPSTGAYIEVSPSDINSEGYGNTDFTRLYSPYSTVTLTAPDTHNDRDFGYWILEGTQYSEWPQISVKMDFNHTAVAVYPVWTLTVESTPDTGVYIGISPDDKNGLGDGNTSFTREYNHGATVTLDAPEEYSGKKFVRWFKDGTSFDDASTTSIDMKGDYSLTVYYSEKLEWRYWVDTQSLPLSPAISSDGTVYFCGDVLYALNPDGTLKWELNILGLIDTSPSIGSDGTIYFSNWDELYAINPDKTLKWTFFGDSFIESALAIGSDGTIYFTDQDKICAVYPDGTFKWGFSYAASYIRSPPVIGSDGTIYYGGGDTLFALDPDGTKKWEYTAFSTIKLSPAIGSDGTIYFTDWFSLFALNPDGTLKWESNVASAINSSPTIGSDGTIYTGGWDSFFALYPDGTLKWEFTPGDSVESSPAIGSDGIIYFGSSDFKFYALNPDGTLKWELITGDSIKTSPAISSDGTVYFASDDGILYALGSDSLGLADSSWPKFRQNNGNTGRASSTVDNSPSVYITFPSDTEVVSGIVIVQASASDDNEVSKTEFYINDELKSTDTVSPYSYSWDTTSYFNGNYKIEAVVYDDINQTNSDEIFVDVSNDLAILGYVRTSGGSGIEDVVIGGLPGSPTTDSDGYYIGAVDVGWSGTVTPAKTGYSFSPSSRDYTNMNLIQQDQDYTGSIIQYTLTIAAGTGGTTDPIPGSCPYDYGTQVPVTAVPSTGYQFSGWSGDVSGTTNPITITMDSGKSITASFSTIDDGGGGEVSSTTSSENGGLCFIATASYGSSLHPHVKALRDFRDRYLMSNRLGRTLVNLYYKYSPPVASFIAKHKILKIAVRIHLVPLVVFSYSLVNFGPIITSSALFLLFFIPLCFFRRGLIYQTHYFLNRLFTNG
ncbi:MAG: S8 family serine peptidase [Candidatus Aminicenantes bacterium]|nr:S8 family serine peptidase [Candidatus Aminicenantes bacterium]